MFAYLEVARTPETSLAGEDTLLLEWASSSPAKSFSKASY